MPHPQTVWAEQADGRAQASIGRHYQEVPGGSRLERETQGQPAVATAGCLEPISVIFDIMRVQCVCEICLVSVLNVHIIIVGTVVF